MMGKIKGLAVLNALSLILQVLVGYFIQLGIITDTTVSEISSKYPTLLTPASSTFSIWGIIYTTLGIFCLYHIVIAYKHDANNPTNADTARIGPWFIITNVAASGWLLAWCYEQLWLAVVLILIQLFGLLKINTRLHIVDIKRSPASRICTQFPLSIYFGWITIATVLNIVVALVAGGTTDLLGLSGIDWAIILVTIVTIIAMIVVYQRRNVYYGLTIIWGLRGIALERELENAEQYSSLINAAWIGIGLILLSCFIRVISNLFYRKGLKPVSE